MPDFSGNRGIVNMGGDNRLSNNAVGDGAVVHDPSPHRTAEFDGGVPEERWDFGVVTILSEESRAVCDEFGLTAQKTGGRFFSTGEVDSDGVRVRVVEARAQSQGNRSAMATCQQLRHHFDPRVLVMVGVGGGIGSGRIGVGDVVVSTRVVYYDLRKETAGGTVRRGEEREAPASIVHSVNMFFTVNGQPAELERGGASFLVAPSPVGSGDAVIADAGSDVRHYLTGFNDKILVVDMEAGGLSQYWQENSVDPSSNPGWVVVRGISDHADASKGHSDHDRAARNAALVARRLLRYLR